MAIGKVISSRPLYEYEQMMSRIQILPSRILFNYHYGDIRC